MRIVGGSLRRGLLAALASTALLAVGPVVATSPVSARPNPEPSPILLQDNATWCAVRSEVAVPKWSDDSVRTIGY